jgi:hypothetical protein
MERMLYDSVVDEPQLSWYSVSSSHLKSYMWVGRKICDHLVSRMFSVGDG